MTQFENIYIAISGLIGAGKSTLAVNLAKAMDLPVYHEPVANNPYLVDFYRDMASVSFQLEVYLLYVRAEQQEIIFKEGKGAVQDRSLYEDMVFTKMLLKSGKMTQRDFELYSKLFQDKLSTMRRPSLIVHLDVTPEMALSRIQLRMKREGREFERAITVEYLQALRDEYEVFLREISRVIPVIRIDYEKFHDTDAIVKAVRREYEEFSTCRYAKVE